MQVEIIQNKIYEIRGQKVMLDFDLAILYEVETKVFNQAVKRNIESFPEDFMFQLTRKEWNILRSQIVTLDQQNTDNQQNNWSQIVTSKTGKGKFSKYLPYAFTEHGVTMLASILKSPKARQMNIAIVRAFISLRKFALQYTGLLDQLQELNQRVGNNDAQLNQIYEAIENLLGNKKAEQQEWNERERIGFKK